MNGTLSAPSRIRIGLAQVNVRVGRPADNRRRLEEWMAEARARAVDILLFPELALSGYPPEDLLFRSDFIAACWAELETLAQHTVVPLVVVGLPRRGVSGLTNTAAVLVPGRVAALYDKQHLPNYGVFDEARYFTPGHERILLEWAGWRIGLSVCEDVWLADGPWLEDARAGADLLLNISASPYHRDKPAARDRMLATRAQDAEAFLAACNLVGGQDELVFDGTSAVYGPDGAVLARAASFAEELLTVDLDPEMPRYRRGLDRRWFHREPGGAVRVVPVEGEPAVHRPGAPATVRPFLEPVEELRRALVLGLKDYVEKNGFAAVVVGLSGGIDSSVTAALAVEALGAERVHGIFLPSAITSRESREDAEQLAAALGIDYHEIGIAPIFEASMAQLAELFRDRPWNEAEENLQARIRGNLLMALSNKFGWLVLITGNKSEMATGYSTLYGDMAGGFGVLKDVYKRDVYRLAEAINRDRPVIPPRVLEKAPTAELRPGQRDEDSLPPYAVLDQILAGYVEQDLSPEELIARGFDPEHVRLTVKLVNRNEYKRRQAPVGTRVSPRAFGRDRRMPITGRFPDV
jgi:NAD+ synthase (glutamine-hydrolysing)